MKKIILITLLLAGCPALVVAQSSETAKPTVQRAENSKPAEAPKPADVPARINLPPDAQASLSASSERVRAAQSALEAAALARENLILRLRLLLGVPNDYEMRADKEGGIYFEKTAAQGGSEQQSPKP